MMVKRKTIKERLEGSYRLIRIKRIKLGFFTLQIVLAIVLGLVVAMFLGARFEPLFVPLDVFAFSFLLLMLIIAAEAVYFKGLELRYTRSRSRKFLIARNSIRKSSVILALAVLCVIFLMVPFSAEKIAEMHPQTDSDTLQIGEDGAFTFDTQDSLGLTRVTRITISTNATAPIGLSFYNEEGVMLWEDPSFDLNTYNFNDVGLYSSMIMEIECRINHTGADIVGYTWTTENDVSPFLTQFLPLLGIAFVIVELISISIMYPTREAHAVASIYSKKYVVQKDASEYLITERQARERAQEEALLESTLDIDVTEPAPPPPPPPKVVVPRPVPVKKEVARKMGEVDEDLIEEPDIPCPTCGEMNSPHAAMCFVCGNPMVVKEVPTVVDLTDVFISGMKLSKDGKHDEAIKRFDEILVVEKANEDALLGKGTTLHKQGKWGQAIQYVNTALKINPNNVDALLQKAEILAEREKFDKAIETYDYILTIDPDNPKAKAGLEELTEEAEIEDVEVVLEQFMCVPGLGLARATTLYESGFTSLSQLKAASEQDLAQVKGISERLAKKIKKYLETID